ncbi:hypothetical protein SAMN05444746_10195 [Variovorax sp. OK212]|nr:hypothetical protein SAMN05518853_10195 [Variovorax sp. OK202]SFB84546.1 hypothetical protein SAMN05444746_10195 [Variovorax sp. OK212]
MLTATIDVARRGGVVRAFSVDRVVVDMTVMLKTIAHPTCSEVLERSRQHLLKTAEEHGLCLRQPYNHKIGALLARTGRILAQRTKDKSKSCMPRRSSASPRAGRKPTTAIVGKGHWDVDIEDTRVQRSGQKRDITRMLRAMIDRRIAISP